MKGHNELKGYEWKQCPCFNYAQVLAEKENIEIKEEVKLYTVERGDTLWAISQKTGGSVKTLLRLNPNVDPRALQPGQQIIIEKLVKKERSENSITTIQSNTETTKHSRTTDQ